MGLHLANGINSSWLIVWILINFKSTYICLPVKPFRRSGKHTFAYLPYTQMSSFTLNGVCHLHCVCVFSFNKLKFNKSFKILKNP